MELTFITGKGGVGKSALTASLATALAAQTAKVGIIELGETRMADFFETAPQSYEGTPGAANIVLLNLNAPACFQEYVRRHLPPQILPLLKNKWVHHFLDATPGLNEILLLGKITSLMKEKPWDFLLVDAPATGHTISLCDAPRIALKTLRKGPLRTTVGEIWDTLHDPKQTNFLLVTQLESFIVEETLELYQNLTQTMEMSPKGIVVNNMMNPHPTFTAKIPISLPKAATPLVEMISQMQKRQHRQKILKEKLRESFSVPIGFLCEDISATKEGDLRKHLSRQLQPWIFKNYSLRKGS